MATYTQPAEDIKSFINGYQFSIRCQITSLYDQKNKADHYSKPYLAGREAGHAKVKLTQLIKGT